MTHFLDYVFNFFQLEFQFVYFLKYILSFYLNLGDVRGFEVELSDQDDYVRLLLYKKRIHFVMLNKYPR